MGRHIDDCFAITATPSYSFIERDLVDSLDQMHLTVCLLIVVIARLLSTIKGIIVCWYINGWAWLGFASLLFGFTLV